MHLLEKDWVRLSDRFLKKLVPDEWGNKEGEDIKSLEALLKKVVSGDLLGLLRNSPRAARVPAERPRPDFLEKVFARTCAGKREFSFAEGMKLRLREWKEQVARGPSKAAQVFVQLMARNRLDKLRPSGRLGASLGETALAVYYLADANLKRVLATNLFRTDSAIPLLFANSKAFVAPLAALSLKTKLADGDTVKVNALLHPSAKWTFFQTHPAPKSPQSLARDLFVGSSAFAFPELERAPDFGAGEATFATFLGNLKGLCCCSSQS